MKLLRVTLRVRDQQEALRFYIEKLGFVKRSEMPMGPGQTWITVAPPEEDRVQIVLQPPDWFTGAEREKHMQVVGHNPAIVFQVDDCKATFQRLQDRGVHFTQPPDGRPYGIEADAVDMDGNTLVFLQPLPSRGG